MTLERSGSRDRTVRRMETRTRQQTDDLASRLEGLETGAAGILEDLALTTTPQAFEHGLQQVAGLNVPRGTAPTNTRLVGRTPTGAYIIRGHGTFYLIVGTRTDRTIELSISAGTATVTVQVV